MRLVLTGAWLDVAYFEIELLLTLNKKIRYILTMRTLNLHTIYCLPTLKVWAGISMFNSQDEFKLEDTDVG